MTPDQWIHVIRIAYEVRDWAEDFARKNRFPGDLCGMCAIVSGEISKRLAAKRIKHEIALSREHAFLIVDEMVVDATASQYTCDQPVVIKPLDDVKSSIHYKKIETFSNVRDAKKYLARRWPASQQMLQ